MGLFPQLVETRSRKRSTGSLDAYNDFWYGVAGTGTKSGVTVSEKTALKYLTVFSCVSLIAGDVARLPLILYRKFPNGSKERVIDHPLYDLMHTAPNPEIDSHKWREAHQGHLLLWGNEYNQIERNRYTGGIKYIWPLENPGGVTVKRNEKNRIFYRWTNRNGEIVTKFRDEMFHIPGFGFNGLQGLSMIALAREAIGLGLAAEEFHGRFFGDGTHPSVVVTIPPDVNLGEKEKEYKKKLKKTLAGLKNAHGIAVFNNGEKAERLTMDLADAQFLESRDHQKTEICGMFHVPPHKIALHGANSNYNNLEQENQSYVDSCLIHWTTRWETSISHQLLTERERRAGLFFEFKIDGLLRGDSQARGEFYKTLHQMGYPLNRVLAKENENPVPGGDQGFIPLNMIPLDRADDLAASQIDDGGNGEGRSVRVSRAAERRSVVMRDRISRQYFPLIERAAEKIVTREAVAVKRKVDKFRKQRAHTEMEQWLEEFYRDLPEYIQLEIGPVFRSFALAVADAAADEIGESPDANEVDRFVRDYIDRYAERHSSSSLGQLRALLKGELDELETRVDEWTETRPEKIARNETVRGANGIYQLVVFAAGLSTVWRIRGADTCPYCKELNGKKVRSGEWFVADGEELNPQGGTGPMKNRGLKTHPPLHQGCDCYLGMGR